MKVIVVVEASSVEWLLWRGSIQRQGAGRGRMPCPGREGGGGRIFCCMYMYCGERIITKGKEWCKTDTSGRIKRGGWGVRMRKTVRGGKKIT